MGLQLIYGRAGSGKSEYCFEQIVDKVKEKNKIYMITPEQFSFTQEKKLLENLKEDAVINAEVLTFHRMAYRVMQSVGGVTKTNFSKSGKAMLIAHVLEKQKTNLTFLNKSDENIEIIEKQIKEFKKHMVTASALKEVIEDTSDLYLKAKLEDIFVLYNDYEETIKEQYIDEEDVLTILANRIDETDLFKDTVIYIDEFSGFTKQEYEIIRKLMKIAKEVHITICADNTNIVEDSNDIFKNNKETIERLKQIAKEEKIVIEKDIHQKEVKRLKKEELIYIENNLAGVNKEKYLKTPENLSLFLAKDPFAEAEEIASKIIYLVKEKGYRYKDISVITKNIESEAPIIQAVFTRFEIPVFMDQKKEVSQNILVQYLVSVLEIFAKSWSYESMFHYLKMSFSNIPLEDIFLLENYCIQYGIRGRKWYAEEWKIAKDDETLEKLNHLRRQVVEPLLEFKNKLDRGKTAKDISKALYEFLIQNQIDEKLEEKAQALEKSGRIELANLYQTTWDLVMQVLDEIVLVLGDEKLSFENYEKIWKVGLKNTTLGAIPATCDQVIVGDIERSRSHKVRSCFILGLNDGVFPSINREEGFLNDKDRSYLKEKNLEIAKDTLDQLYEENFNIYKAFVVPEEKLYLSYTSSDAMGKTLRPSILISKIKRIFPELIEKSDMVTKQDQITTKEATFYELLTNIRKFQDGEEISPIWFSIYQFYSKEDEYKEKIKEFEKAIDYDNKAQVISKENIQKLYGDTLKTSISRLEQYKRCGFSFYLKYGLGLNEKSLFQVQSLDTGSLMHNIIDEFFDQVLQRGISLRQMTTEEIEQIVKSILNEQLSLKRNYIFNSNKRYQFLTRRLEKIILKSIESIIQTITQSDFDVYGNEVEFKKNANYPPIEITLDDGKKVEITGKIDRVDLAKGEKGNYVRIIDYKSSVKNIDLNEVMAGLQIQLLTYLDAVTKTENVIPAGVLYFNLIDPIIKADRNKTNEEIEQEIKKQFKMQGLILADVKVVRMMDKKLEKGASNIVPAYIDQSENLSPTRSSTVSKKQFEDLQKQMKKIIKEIAKEIYSGKMEIQPYYNTKKKKTPCEYCEYKSICNFDPNYNSYFYIPNKDKQEILEQIKE